MGRKASTQTQNYTYILFSALLTLIIFGKNWPPGYDFFFMLNLNLKFILFINVKMPTFVVKMPTIVGSLTFMKRINTASESFKMNKNLCFSAF